MPLFWLKAQNVTWGSTLIDPGFLAQILTINVFTTKSGLVAKGAILSYTSQFTERFLKTKKHRLSSLEIMKVWGDSLNL